ncbi:caspase family protein [bacterium]|nr:caspase family protein [bacterium]
MIPQFRLSFNANKDIMVLMQHRVDIIKKGTTLLLAVFLITTSFVKQGHAEQIPFRVLLFSGGVFLLDTFNQRFPVTVNQEITPEHYTWIELTPGSKLFLQKGEHLLRMDVSGRFEVAAIDKKQGTGLSNALQFLSALSKPRSFSRQARVRSSQPVPDTPDPVFFNGIWENLVLSQTSSTTPVPPEDVMAAAAWYYQQGKPARTAYLLEHLDNDTHPRNPFLQQLRNDSLNGVPLATINEEVETTRRDVAERYRQFRYKALLIGIDQYDHPAWQPLDNPIRDITAIRQLLIDSYRFRPEDITSLENPVFSQIIDAFQHLKKTVDDQTHLIIYYAGHGYYPADEGEGYWIPRNGGDPGSQRFFIPTTVILSKMNAIKSRHTLLITDSCFSGSLIRKSRGSAVDSGFYRELSQKKSRQIITSGGLEPVSDSGRGNHSVFAGNLLQILSAERSEPLSASELAFQLRKSLKNTGVRQTPEYGRLTIPDDENGEFFFVRRDQSLVFAQTSIAPAPAVINIKESESNGLSIIGMTNPPENDGSAFQARGQESWGGLGLFHYQGRLEYNYRRPASAGTLTKVKIAASLEGKGLKAEYRRTNHRGGYGLSMDLGQFTGIRACASDGSVISEIGIQNCEDDNQFSNLNGTTLAGHFSHLGVFADYSVLTWQEISVQLGGEVQYQYYLLNRFLEETDLDSSTMGACGKSGVTYRNGKWLARLFVDFCLTTVELGGSLHKVDNTYGNDVRVLTNLSVGLAAGVEF